MLYHIVRFRASARRESGDAKGGIRVSVYACELCGYEYRPEVGDPEHGVPEGTDFEDLPADWVCPLCGASKDDFEQVAADESNTESGEL